MEDSLSSLAFAVENECGCNERPAVYRALRDSARDFCVRSEGWIAESIFDNEPGSDVYDGAGANDAFVHKVLLVQYIRDGKRAELHEREYELIDSNFIRLKKDHAETDQVRIVAVLIPNPESEELPEELVMRYRDGLVYGACARLAGQVGKPWFSPELEQKYQLQFLREVTRAISAGEEKAGELSRCW